MRKLLITLILILVSMATMIPVASAQEESVSGCVAFGASNTTSTFPVNQSGDFIAGDSLTFSVAGPGDFVINVNDTTFSPTLTDGGSFTYEVTAGEFVAFLVEVTNETANSSVTIDCTPAEDDDGGFDGTLCHIPPGNPNAAHTITVGSQNAVEAHLAHGDIGGPCIDGIQTRSDLPSIGITIFIILADNTIQLYGDCESECADDFVEVSIEELINFNLIVINVDGDDEFIEIDDPEDYDFPVGEVTPDGVFAVLFYLHPDPQNPNVGVFQLNLFDNGVVIDGSTLIFISASGDIVLWTGQDIWEKLLEEAEDDDDDV